MTLQKHKPVQHKSPLTHCQNTLRQIAKNNPSLCQPHTHTHTHTQILRDSSALDFKRLKLERKNKISERKRKRNKERVIHPIVSFHNPRFFLLQSSAFQLKPHHKILCWRFQCVSIYLCVCVCVCVCVCARVQYKLISINSICDRNTLTMEVMVKLNLHSKVNNYFFHHQNS